MDRIQCVKLIFFKAGDEKRDDFIVREFVRIWV